MDGDYTGSLPADISTTVADMSAALVNVSATVENTSAAGEAQRLTKIVPGTTNPMGGTLPDVTPTAGTQFIIQTGSVSVAANEFGDISFNWPEPFSTAILSVQLTSGDNVPREQGPIALRRTTDLTTCRANAIGRTSGAGPAGGPVRCDYIAIGY